MIFAKKAILYLTKNKVYVLAGRQQEQDYEIDWDGVKLSEAFAKIKQDLKIGSTKVVVSADFSYSLVLDNQPDPTRDQILSKIKTLIPEELDNYSFDWQKTTNGIQVIGISPFLLNAISYAAKETKIKVNLILPICILLTKSTPTPNPSIIIYQIGPTITLAISHLNLCYFAKTVKKVDDKELTDLLTFAKDSFSFTIKNLIHNLEDDLPKKPDLDVSKTNLNPLQFFASLPKSGKDQDVLAILPLKNPTDFVPTLKDVAVNEVKTETEQTKQDEETETSETTITEEKDEEPTTDTVVQAVITPKTNKRIWFLLIPLLFLLLALLAGGFYVAYQSKFVTKPEPTPTETPTPTPTPTPEPVDFSQYTVSILNGSGIKGEANVVKDLLTDIGFKEITTGNASSYDFSSTQVQLKTDVPLEVFSQIDKILSTGYTVIQADTLAEDATTDIVITVGIKK